MPNLGKLFVFEGPDGVGKSTISQGVAKRFLSEEIPCIYLTFPGKEIGTLGHLVYQIHHEPKRFKIKQISQTSLQTLHISAHIDAIENTIIPAIKDGKIVLLDRYWWSTYVYGIVNCANRDSLHAMIQLEKIHWKFLKPTIAFLITSTKPLRKETSLKIWKKLRQEYENLAKKEQYYYKVIKIMNDSSISHAVNQIFKKIINHKNKITSQNFLNDDQVVQGGESTNRGNLNLKRNFWSQKQYNNEQQITGIVFSRLSPAKPTKVFDTYWQFAAERQTIFFKKVDKLPSPWTKDPILEKYKFTNVYRASDRISQYLIKNVIYEGDQSPQEIFFRVMLFKTFNRIETWELLIKNLESVSYSEYTFKLYNKILGKSMRSGKRIYSAAYIMTSGESSFGYSRKYQNHLKLIELMMQDEVPNRIVDLKSMKELFELLRSYPTIGDFLAYQYATDINYSELTDFSEKEFVMPGPGARDGIHKCFSDLGGLNEVNIIQIMVDRQFDEFNRLDIDFHTLWGRPLQLIDCQNLFCEVGKYARVAHPEKQGISKRKRIKQNYRPNLIPINYWYPPKWKLNERIKEKTKY